MYKISCPFFFRLHRLSKESVQVRVLFWMFVTNLILRWGVVSAMPNPKLGDYPLSAVRDCLFSIFAAALHNWRASSPSATWGRAMPWWQGTHLTWYNAMFSLENQPMFRRIISLPFQCRRIIQAINHREGESKRNSLTRRHIPEDTTFRNYHCENLKSYNKKYRLLPSELVAMKKR
jgi:hypothetical protein